VEELEEEVWMIKEMSSFLLEVIYYLRALLTTYQELRDFPPSDDLKKIIDHKGELLESKFRLTYGIIFNLLLSKEINVEF